MGKITKLIDIVRNLDCFDELQTIYALEPWTAESTAIVAMEPDAGYPTQALQLSLKYFLEVSVAKEFLNDWIDSLEERPTIEEQCAVVIHYAINDA
ncbi:MAG TPA: hypothetical protein VF753_03795 [Terriglobales bacterium]